MLTCNDFDDRGDFIDHCRHFVPMFDDTVIEYRKTVTEVIGEPRLNMTFVGALMLAPLRLPRSTRAARQ